MLNVDYNAYFFHFLPVFHFSHEMDTKTMSLKANFKMHNISDEPIQRGPRDVGHRHAVMVTWC